MDSVGEGGEKESEEQDDGDEQENGDMVGETEGSFDGNEADGTIEGDNEMDRMGSTKVNEMVDPLAELESANLNNKNEQNNAKAVECLDLDGNLVAVFRSGMQASQQLNVPRSEISQCCRGVKDSTNGYKFRFVIENDLKTSKMMKIKKGFAFESVMNDSKNYRAELTRTTRASRGEISTIEHHKYSGLASFKEFVITTSCIKARTWTKKFTKCGNIIVPKWIPNIPKPTQELQSFLPKKNDSKKMNKKRRQSEIVN